MPCLCCKRSGGTEWVDISLSSDDDLLDEPIDDERICGSCWWWLRGVLLAEADAPTAAAPQLDD